MDYMPLYRDIDTSDDGVEFINHADFFGETAAFRSTAASLSQVPLPDGAFARGQFRAKTLRTSLQCMACDLLTAADFEMEGQYHPYLAIGMVISGDWTSRVEDETGAAATSIPGEPVLVATRRPVRFSTVQKAGVHARMVGVCVGPDFFGSFNDEGSTEFSPEALFADGRDFACRTLEGCETLKVTLNRLYHNPYRGVLGAVYAESLVMLALVQASSALVAPPSKPRLPVSGSHREYAHEVRRMIDADIGRVPGVQRIAARFGVGETTLRRAFRDTFGMTIFEYVRDRRLDTAQLLLRERRMHISQIAYSVGYSNLANFSNAYKRRFGYAPRKEG